MSIKNSIPEREGNIEKGKAINVGNFLSECYSEKTNNNGNLVPINEADAKSLIERHTRDGYVIISPCRGYADFGLDPSCPADREKLAHINNVRTKELVGILKSDIFTYTPLYGGFVENGGEESEEEVYERSFVVYNHHKDGRVGDFVKLYDFALEMCNKYNQDSVLVKSPDCNPEYVTKEGNVVFRFGGDASFSDLSQEYFTDLHKNTHRSGDIPDGKPARFSFLESYVNPAPQCYGERYGRYRNGEIFLGK